MGIYGNGTGYQKKLIDARHQPFDIAYETVSAPKPVRTSIVRMDLPKELVEHIELLAESEGLSRNSMIYKLLKEASSERR